MAQMRKVQPTGEPAEPLLSKQVYDIIHEAKQAHTENQLDVGSGFLERGFLPQAGEAEHAARTNMDELQVEKNRAAESVLGSEGQALRYAQKKRSSTIWRRRSEKIRQATPTRRENTLTAENARNRGQKGEQPGHGTGDAHDLRQFADQLGGSGGAGANGPITGNNYMDWSDRVRDVEQAIDAQDVRNQLATVRERVGAYRRNFRENGRVPTKEELQNKVLEPLCDAGPGLGEAGTFPRAK